MSGVSLAVAPRSEPDQTIAPGEKPDHKPLRQQQQQQSVALCDSWNYHWAFLATVLGGFARGDNNAVRSATPHLFLLSFQILTENVISGLSLFSPPVRALVPLLYTVRRVFVILDWMHGVWLNRTLPANAKLKDIAWDWFGKGLGAANLLYFSINLLCFLIPRFLPRAFERYFREREEIHGKMSEDKRPTAANKSQATDKKVD
ncbi:hypothetical protein CRYUN_Cryun21dG0046300 [Craigia yunnanensis]